MSRICFSERRLFSFVELATKTLQNLSVQSQGGCNRQEEKNELLLPVTAAAAFCQQLPPFDVKCCHTRCVCAQSRGRVLSHGFAALGRAAAAPGDPGGSP